MRVPRAATALVAVTALAISLQGDATRAADGLELVGPPTLALYPGGAPSPAAVAAGHDGRILVVWSSDYHPPIDDNSGILGVCTDPFGAWAGPVFAINSYTPDAQESPGVAALLDGRFVVAWGSGGSGGSDAASESIQRRFLSATCAPLGSDEQVNEATWGIQRSVAIAMSGNATGLIAWRGPVPGAPSHVRARRIDVEGDFRSGELAVSPAGPGFSDDVAVAMGRDGGSLVVWHQALDTEDETEEHQIRGRALTPSGFPASADFRIDTGAAAYRSDPRLAATGSGFVVVWPEVRRLEGSNERLRGFGLRLVGPRGELTSSQSLLDARTTDGFQNPRVAGLPDGGFVRTWSTDPELGPRAIYVRRHAENGSAIGPAVEVSQPVACCAAPTSGLLTADDGTVTILWRESDYELGTQRLRLVGGAPILADDFEAGSLERWAATGSADAPVTE